MESQRKRLAFVAGALLLIAAQAPAQSTIDATDSFAWGENIGWVNFHPTPADGVVVTANYLQGFAWSENFGWIHLGSVPDNSLQYTQGLNDTGVNNDGAGNLSGFAWGENIGWINFDTSGSGGSQVTIDGSGQFGGFAWGENVGWINMNSGYGVLNTTSTSVNDWMLLDEQ
jgi:hypothetical protein